MKKGSEWFKLLSEKEQQEFKENCGDFKKAMSYRSSWFRFIARAFEWMTSPQGHYYWQEISERQL
jgi:hypothetical protein